VAVPVTGGQPSRRGKRIPSNVVYPHFDAPGGSKRVGRTNHHTQSRRTWDASAPTGS